MARKIALAPESFSLHEQLVAEKAQDSIKDMPNLLPKNMRGKARILVHYLNGISVNDMQRIVYNDGEVGSHVLDLVKYAVSPFFQKQRPLDWPKFLSLLESLGVPESAIARKVESKIVKPSPKVSILDNWIV